MSDALLVYVAYTGACLRFELLLAAVVLAVEAASISFVWMCLAGDSALGELASY